VKEIEIKCQGAGTLPLENLTQFQGNLKTITPANLKKLRSRILDTGFVAPIFIWKNEKINYILDGTQRLLALKSLQQKGYHIPDLPVAYIEADNEEDARKKLLSITSTYGDFNLEELQGWLVKVDEDIADSLRFFDKELNFEMAEQNAPEAQKLSERFIVPPFSIFDTKLGYWQDRKRIWKSIIMDNGESRKETLCSSEYDNSKYHGNVVTHFVANVSLLDPVLSEIICYWFTLPNSNIFDCFAGDTVFGYVAASTGHSFTGIELRQEQVDYNNARTTGMKAKYICDDAINVFQHFEPGSQDLLFSCPPYYNLEKYSDLDEDASNQETYPEFLEILDKAFTDSIKCLKPDSFAVIVVGDVRNTKTGEYYCFPDDIKQIFKKNGMMLYNEIILLESLGSAMLRSSRFMDHRKVVKIHQNVLVFYNGNQKNIKGKFPRVEVAEIESSDV